MSFVFGPDVPLSKYGQVPTPQCFTFPAHMLYFLNFDPIYGNLTIYMAATQIYYSKITLVHSDSEEAAIAELKVWKVPVDAHFPEGIKYSLFLVSLETKKVVVGFDNHKPKGHHFHHHDSEELYNFVSVDQLIDDFWGLAKQEGYII